MHEPLTPSEAQPDGEPRRGALAFIFVTVVLDMLALGIVVPVLPKLVLGFEQGDSAHAAMVYGLFGTVFATMQFLFAPLLGALSDRFGRRPAILLSNLGLGLDYVVMAVAPSIGWLMFGRIISGICAASFSIPMAYIADVTPPEKRAASFGRLGAAFGLGFVIGPAFGGLLGNFDPRLPFWIAAGFSLCNALYGFFVLPESLPPERRARLNLRHANPVGALLLLREYPRVLGIAGVVFLASVAHESLPSMWVLYTNYRYQWDERATGLTLALLGVCSAVVQAGLVGRVVSWLGERRGILLGEAFGISGFLVYAMAPVGWLFCLGVPLSALWGFAGASAQSLMTRQVDPSEQGRLQGAIAATQGVAHMIGPGLFTSIFALSIETTSGRELPGSPYYLAALVLASAWVVAWFTAKPMPHTLVTLPVDDAAEEPEATVAVE